MRRRRRRRPSCETLLRSRGFHTDGTGWLGEMTQGDIQEIGQKWASDSRKRTKVDHVTRTKSRMGRGELLLIRSTDRQIHSEKVKLYPSNIDPVDVQPAV